LGRKEKRGNCQWEIAWERGMMQANYERWEKKKGGKMENTTRCKEYHEKKKRKKRNMMRKNMEQNKK